MVVERGCWTAPEALSGADAASFAKRVEELGYSQLWVGETFGRDPFALAAHLGAVTSTLGARHRDRQRLQPARGA